MPFDKKTPDNSWTFHSLYDMLCGREKLMYGGEQTMNVGFFACGTLSLIFLLLAVIFAILKGKASVLISGFNSKSKEERSLYDEEKMCADQRNAFLIWAAILGIGAIFSYLISQYSAIVAIVIWLIIFFKDVHWDDEKAFGKYKK